MPFYVRPKTLNANNGRETLLFSNRIISWALFNFFDTHAVGYSSPCSVFCTNTPPTKIYLHRIARKNGFVKSAVRNTGAEHSISFSRTNAFSPSGVISIYFLGFNKSVCGEYIDAKFLMNLRYPRKLRRDLKFLGSGKSAMAEIFSG